MKFNKNIFTAVFALLVLSTFASALTDNNQNDNIVASIWFDNYPDTSSLTINDGTSVPFHIYGLATGSSLTVQVDLITPAGVVPIEYQSFSYQDFNEFGIGNDYIITSAEYGGVGNHKIRLTVTGDSISTAVLELDLIVSAVPVNNAPVFTSVPVLTVQEGQVYSYDADGFDVDGNTLTYSLSTNPGWLSINPSTGIVSGTAPAVTSNQNYNVVVTVSDGVAFANQPYTLTVLDTIVPPSNNAPVITSTPVLSVNENSAYAYDVDATDADGNVLTYSLDSSSPAWLSINSVTGLVTGTAPSVSANTNFNVKVQVSDGVAQTMQTYTITVNDVASPSSGGNGGNGNSGGSNKKVTYIYQDPSEEKYIAQTSGFVAPKIDLATPEAEKSWFAGFMEAIINFFKRIFS